MMDQSEYGAQPYPASGAAWIRKNAIYGPLLTKLRAGKKPPGPAGTNNSGTDFDDLL
jgi:hypothetical protein